MDNPSQEDKTMFNSLWEKFHSFPGLVAVRKMAHETLYKVCVTYRNQTREIGFAHQLEQLSQEQIERLLDLYFPETPILVAERAKKMSVYEMLELMDEWERLGVHYRATGDKTRREEIKQQLSNVGLTLDVDDWHHITVHRG